MATTKGTTNKVTYKEPKSYFNADMKKAAKAYDNANKSKTSTSKKK